jgi:hypothetical protein
MAKSNLRAVRAQYKEAVSSLPHLVEAARLSPSPLPQLVSTSLKAAKVGSVLGLGPAQLFQYLRLAEQANAALFAGMSGLPVRAPLGDQFITLTRPPDESYLHVTRWLLAFFSALLCRDLTSLSFLTAVSSKQLRKSTTKFADYGYFFVDAIHGFLAGADNTGKLILKALRAANPDQYPVSDPDAALYLDFPVIQTFCLAVTSDDRFGAALADAVRDHEHFWANRTGPDDFKGYLSIELLGVAALAYDRGMKFDLESRYVPMALVRGEGLKGDGQHQRRKGSQRRKGPRAD